MKNNGTLSEEIKSNIVKILRTNASPRHVPALMFQVSDLPVTLNGKKVEVAVSNIFNGRKVTNKDALANPECLIEFEKIFSEIY